MPGGARSFLLAALQALLAASALAAGTRIDRFDYDLIDPYRPRFVKTTVASETVYQTRDYGARRLETFKQRKDPGVFRVFVIGGSVAQLYDGSGGGTLKEAVEAALPGRRVEVVNCGSNAYDSSRDLLVLREILGYGADAVVLMTGVNENRYLPPRWVAAAYELARHVPALKTAFEQALLREARRWDMTRSQGEVLRIFEANLEAMLGMAGKRGVRVVLCTLPVDLQDMPPRGALPLGDSNFFAAWRLWERGRAEPAAPLFLDYLKAHPEDAFGWYSYARCLDRLGDHGKAKEYYIRARDLSDVPVTELNAVVRRAAGRRAAVADLERVFEGLAPDDGIVGWEYMQDDIHWVSGADALVSGEIARSLSGGAAPRPASKPPRTGSGAWEIFRYRVWDPRYVASPVFCERELALLDRIRRRSPEVISDPPRLRRWIAGRMKDNVWDQDAAAALDRWWPVLLAHVGELHRRRGDAKTALRFYDAALRLDPGLDKARLYKAVVLAGAGRRAEAQEEAARLIDQTNPEARNRLRDCGLKPL